MRTYFETLSKEELIDQLIRVKALLKIEELQSTWLDETITALRDDEEEPNMPSEGIKEIKERFNKQIISDNFKL